MYKYILRFSFGDGNSSRTQQSVEIAERTANAPEKKSEGDESYELAVKALGGENVTRYKITEDLSKGNIKLIPDVLIGGNDTGDGNKHDGLLGLKLMEMMDPKKDGNDSKQK